MPVSKVLGYARTSLVAAALAAPMVSPGLLGSTGAAYAQGVPTVDTQQIAQQVQQLKQMLEDFGIQSDQLNKLLEQIELLQKQIDKLEETYAALSGITDVAKMAMEGNLNGLLDQEFTDMIDLAQQIANGDYSGLIGSAAPQLQSQMQRVLTEAGFDDNTLREMATSGNAGAQNLATQASTGAVMTAAAQNSHAEAAQSLERVDELVGMIEEMETLKASVDHNTRVTAELAVALTRMWELEAIQTVGAGQGGVLEAAARAEEQRYMDFTLPEMQ